MLKTWYILYFAFWSTCLWKKGGYSPPPPPPPWLRYCLSHLDNLITRLSVFWVCFQAYKKFKIFLLQMYPLLRNKMWADVPFCKITLGLFIKDVRTQGGFLECGRPYFNFSATENCRLFYSVFGFPGQCEPRIKRTVMWFKGAKRTQNKSHDCTFYVTLRCACSV